MLRFVSARVEREWNDRRLSPKVKAIVNEAAGYAAERWGWNFTLTSIHRTPAEDAALHASGIHVDWRAVDVRTRGRSREAIDDVTRYINRRWIYDPARPNLKVCFAEPPRHRPARALPGACPHPPPRARQLASVDKAVGRAQARQQPTWRHPQRWAGPTLRIDYRWQCPHHTLVRCPMLASFNLRPQVGQASPPRPYTASSCSK